MWHSFLEILTRSTPEGSLINLIILGLFVWGLGALIRQWDRIRRLKAELSKARQTLRQHNASPVRSRTELLSALGWDTQPASAQSPPAQLPGGELRMYIENLWPLRHMGGSAAQAIAELHSLRESLRLETPRYLVSILVFVGLLGTVWGLSGIIAGFEMAVGAAKSAEDPIRQLVAALAPMKTAFSCTFAGILASVSLGLVMVFQSRHQNSVLADVEEFLATEVIPIVFVDQASEELVRVQEVLDRSANLVSEFGEAIAQSRTVFTETLQSAVKAAASEMVTSVERMQSAASGLAAAASTLDDYRQTLLADHQLYTQLLKETRAATVDMVQIAVLPLEQVARVTEQSLEETRALRQQLAEEQHGWRQDLAAALTRMNDAASAMSRSANEMGSYWDRLKADHEVFAEILNETRNATVEMAQTTIAPLSSVTEALQDGVEETRALRQQLAEEQHGWRQDLAAALTHMNKAADGVLESAEVMSSEGRQTISDVRNILREYHSQQLELAVALDELARQLRPELMRTPEGKPLGEVFAEVAESIDALAANVAHLAEGTQDVASRTEKLAELVNSHAAADGQEREEQVRQLTAAVDRLMEGLHQARGDGTDAIAERCAAIEAVLREQLALLQKGWLGRFVDGMPFGRKRR